MVFAQGEWCWLVKKTLMTLKQAIQRADAPKDRDHSPFALGVPMVFVEVLEKYVAGDRAENYQQEDREPEGSLRPASST